MQAQPFSLARRLRNSETVYCAWCGLGSPLVAELTARDGFDPVAIDQQHGLFDMAGTAAAIAGIRAAGAAAIVRVPVGAFSVASRALDFGAEGIVAPMINSVADAKAFVAAVKFPPAGDKSWGPARALSLTGLSQTEYLAAANDAVVAIAMIETRAALKNLDAILKVPGIDAVFVGPSDLSITLTDGATLDPHSKEVEVALDKIVKAAAKTGKIAGAYAVSAGRARVLAERGFRFIAVANDLAFLRTGTAAALKTLKS